MHTIFIFRQKYKCTNLKFKLFFTDSGNFTGTSNFHNTSMSKRDAGGGGSSKPEGGTGSKILGNIVFFCAITFCSYWGADFASSLHTENSTMLSLLDAIASKFDSQNAGRPAGAGGQRNRHTPGIRSNQYGAKFGGGNDSSPAVLFQRRIQWAASESSTGSESAGESLVVMLELGILRGMISQPDNCVSMHGIVDVHRKFFLQNQFILIQYMVIVLQIMLATG